MKRECTCGRPTSGAWVCERCAKTFAWSIVKVAEHYGDLDTIAAKQTRMGASAGAASIGKSQPLVSDQRFLSTRPRAVVDPVTGEQSFDSSASGTQLRWDAWNTMVVWTRTVMAGRPQSTFIGPVCETCIHAVCTDVRRRRWPRGRVSSMSHYLARQFAWILQQAWAPQMLDEFQDLEGRMRRFADQRPIRVYLGACPATVDGQLCDHAVYAIEGDDWGTCTAADCGAIYNVRASHHNLEQALDEQLYTAAELASLSTYLNLAANREQIRKRINQWHTRGVIAAHSHTDAGDPLFPYGEVRVRLYVEYADKESTA